MTGITDLLGPTPDLPLGIAAVAAAACLRVCICRECADDEDEPATISGHLAPPGTQQPRMRGQLVGAGGRGGGGNQHCGPLGTARAGQVVVKLGSRHG